MSEKSHKIAPQVIDEKGQKMELVDLGQENFSLDVYTEDNPYSVVNMMTGRMKNLVQSVPQELRHMTHKDLRRLAQPDGLLNQLRLRFWYAYDESVCSGKKFSMNTVVKGLCDPLAFINMMKDPKNLAYILCPVAGYEIQVQDFLETSLWKMREGLQNIQVESSKDLLAILKVYEVFDKRVHGDYTQKVEKNINVKSKHETQFKSSRDIKKFIKDNELG